MKKKNILLAVMAVSLTLTAGVGSAWAYFTTYAQARGSYTIELGDKTTVEEDFSAWTKHVAITSDADSEPVYVRARAFCGADYELIYSDNGTGKWTPGADGYYYYREKDGKDIILNGGETTDILDVRIENVPEDITDAAAFNVVVIYETTPVRYREDGTPYADWTAKLNTGTVEGGA